MSRNSSQQEGQTPILKGKVICLSGMGVEEKSVVKERVAKMGGTVWGSLLDNVNVVIARDLGTAKCIAAIQLHLSGEQQTEVVDPSWLENCWNEQKFLEPSLFRLKIFGAEVVSTAGFDKDATNQMRKALELLGGTFSETLDCKCTVLISKQMSGKHITFAKKNNIPVVRKGWLDSCLSECKNRPKDEFPLLSKAAEAALSQSEKDSRFMAPIICSQDASNVPLPLFGSFLHPPEDSCSQFSCSQGFDKGEQESKESFLDGFKIFIAKDISDADCKELRILCRQAGATTVSRDGRNLPSNRRVTHILTAASQRQKEHEDILEVCDRSPPVLQQAWLRESCRLQCCLPIAQFEVAEQELPARAHSVSSSQEQSGATQVGAGMQRKASGSAPAVKLLGAKPASVPPDASEPQTFKPFSRARTSVQAAGTTSSAQLPEPDNDPITEEPVPAVAEQSANIFVGHTFEIQIDDDKVKAELQKMIKLNGGKVQDPPKRTFGLGRKFSGAAKSTALQYQVVRMDAPEEAVVKAVPSLGRKPPKSEVKRVSEYWVRKCAAAGVLFPASAHCIYAPLKHSLPLAALSELSLCMTGTKGPHRKVVSWLLEQAGVQVKDKLKKKISHLLVALTPDSPTDKQRFADQHSIPQVSLAWIEACVAAGKPVEVTPELAPTEDPFHSPTLPKPSPAGFEVDAAFAAMAARDSQSRKRPLELMSKSVEKSPAKRIDFESSTKKPLDFTRVGGASPAKKQLTAPHSILQPDFEAACFVSTRRSPGKLAPTEPARSPAGTRQSPVKGTPATPEARQSPAKAAETRQSPAKAGALAGGASHVSAQAEAPSASPRAVRTSPRPARSPILRGSSGVAPAKREEVGAAPAAEEEFIPDTDEEAEEVGRAGNSVQFALPLSSDHSPGLRSKAGASSVQTTLEQTWSPRPLTSSPGLRSASQTSGVSPGSRSKTAAASPGTTQAQISSPGLRSKAGAPSPKNAAVCQPSGAPRAACKESAMESVESTLGPNARDEETEDAGPMALRQRSGMYELQKALNKRTHSSGPALLAPSASKRMRPCSSPRAPKSPRSPTSAPSASACGLSPAARSPRSPPGSRTRSSGAKGTPPTQVGRKREGRSSNQSSQEADGEEGEDEDGVRIEVDCKEAEHQRKRQRERARKHHQQTLVSPERPTTRSSQESPGEESRVLRDSRRSSQTSQQEQERPAKAALQELTVNRVTRKPRRKYGSL